MDTPLGRIAPLPPGKVPWLARPMLMAAQRMFGKVLAPLQVQARAPRIMWMGNLLGQAIDRKPAIAAALIRLVQIRSAQIIGCPF